MVNERRQNFLSLSELERGSKEFTSSETQGQIVGTRESLNGRKNIYGTKKSKERREELFSPFFTFLRSIYIFPPV